MFRLVILCFFAAVTADLNDPTVRINSGLIEGQLIHSKIINKSYYSFRGIPYAEPPIGKLRFQPPVKPKPWTKTLETKNDGSQCMQSSGGSEDCLFLNVYTPKLSSEKELLPVMVYIHGGAFTGGSADSQYFGPEFLIDKNVVLVVMNYRLNVFGFLNALDDSAPGNAGLKDQVAALKWVQENIEKFNGDPKMVTLFGESAGSASVQYLLQSKLAKGLFHQEILQSGSTLNRWSLEQDPVNTLNKLAKVLNIDCFNKTECINKLRNLSSNELFEASRNEVVLDDNKGVIVPDVFFPSLENDSPDAVITENSFSVISENNINSVPIMIGCVSNEALMYLTSIKLGKLKLELYEKDKTLLVPISLNINNDTDKMKLVADEIENQYFTDVSVTNITAFINFEEDEAFIRGIRKTVELLRKAIDIYYYVFDYKSKNVINIYPGVVHGGELKYIFNTGVEENPEDKLIREKMTTLWTNFAKTGNPTPIEDPVLDNIKWPIVSKSENDKLTYLEISDQLKIKENWREENYQFWEKVFKKYGNPPFYTY